MARYNITTPNYNTVPYHDDFKQLARIAARFLLLSAFLVNARTDDCSLIIAGSISLYGNLLLVKAALRESEVQQIAPGETTYLNKLKVIGTTGSIICSIILFYVLLSEVALRTNSVTGGQISSASAVSAFLL